MATDAPKIGTVVHAVTRRTGSGARNCRAGTVLEPAEIPVGTYPDTEAGNKQREAMEAAVPMKISYITGDGHLKILSSDDIGALHDERALFPGSYHLVEECPYGL